MRQTSDNSLRTARRIEIRAIPHSHKGYVGNRDRVDFFRIDLTSLSQFELTLTQLEANADVALLNRRGKILAKSHRRGKKNEAIAKQLDAGSYYIRVIASTAHDNTRYNLKLSSKILEIPIPIPILNPIPNPNPTPNLTPNPPPNPDPDPDPTPTPTPTIIGSSGDDNLAGTQFNDMLDGKEGNDTLDGADGDDTLVGGSGRDILDGNDGNDTASYAQATRGILVDLSAGFAANLPRVLPLGDSTTYGVTQSYAGVTESGGYRTWLWDKLINANRAVDFVGSQSNGPSTLGDKNHEGNRGKTLDWTSGQINGFLSSSQPDVVLLMLGTNDSGTDTLDVMKTQLSNLIDQITAYSSSLRILVASIPPIRSEAQSFARLALVQAYNDAIPGIVASKQAADKNVEFVDMRSLIESDISFPPNDNGLHPTTSGYSKIANFWYDGLVSDPGLFDLEKDRLTSVENIIGSSYQDRLVGNSGANLIDGGFGNDWLTGGGGADVFVYNLMTAGNDTITDFDSGDVFRISAAGFGNGLVGGVGLSNGGDAATGTFVRGNSPVGSYANFLYRGGVLRFDPDGIGSQAAVAIATLKGSPVLSASQFSIVG